MTDQAQREALRAKGIGMEATAIDRTTRLIQLLERCRQDHYSEPEGLTSCDALMFAGTQYGQCDCGADKLNAEIDQMIAELRQQ